MIVISNQAINSTMALAFGWADAGCSQYVIPAQLILLLAITNHTHNIRRQRTFWAAKWRKGKKAMNEQQQRLPNRDPWILLHDFHFTNKNKVHAEHLYWDVLALCVCVCVWCQRWLAIFLVRCFTDKIWLNRFLGRHRVHSGFAHIATQPNHRPINWLTTGIWKLGLAWLQSLVVDPWMNTHKMSQPVREKERS